MKKWLAACLVLAIAFAGYLAFTTTDSSAPAAIAAKKTYSGTLYVAGMGGHFAKAEVMIDPNDTENPIKILNLDMVRIGNKDTHPTHDARIDSEDRNVMFWSTFRAGPDGNVRVGKSDLRTGRVIKEVALPIDARAKGPAPIYCASGQSEKYFIPVTMATEAYIDVFRKSDLKHKHRVFLDGIGYKTGGYRFFHGINTPDMKGFLVAINLVKDGKPTGEIDLLMLDLPELVKGRVKVLSKNTITGEPGKTITFRQYFTNDGKYLLQSARDRMILIDAKTLKPLDEEMVTGENHDVMPTPDGRYAILTLRQIIKDKEGKDITDGTLQLYDIEARRLVGRPVSTCIACHAKIGIKGSAVLCGVDGNWKKVTGSK
jgi:hypothetical protein